VKQGNITIVELLASRSLPDRIYLAKDLSGSTALHAAVQKSHVDIARTLVRAGPPALLHSENGVGQTAREIADLKDLAERAVLGHGSAAAIPDAQMAVERTQIPDFTARAAALPARAHKLRATLDALFADGTLVHGSPVASALAAFADRVEAKARLIGRPIVSDDAAYVDPKASRAQATATVLREEAGKQPGTRELVHMLDVQRSVEHNVAEAGARDTVTHRWGRNRRRQGVGEDGEDENKKAMQQASLFYELSYSRGASGEVDLFRAEDTI